MNTTFFVNVKCSKYEMQMNLYAPQIYDMLFSHIKHFIFPLGIAQVTYVVHIVLNMCNMYDTKAHLSKYIFSCSVIS